MQELHCDAKGDKDRSHIDTIMTLTVMKDNDEDVCFSSEDPHERANQGDSGRLWTFWHRAAWGGGDEGTGQMDHKRKIHHAGGVSAVIVITTADTPFINNIKHTRELISARNV